LKPICGPLRSQVEGIYGAGRGKVKPGIDFPRRLRQTRANVTVERPPP
jgi:hypothetical protein